jgi:hypothetical protein
MPQAVCFLLRFPVSAPLDGCGSPRGESVRELSVHFPKVQEKAIHCGFSRRLNFLFVPVLPFLQFSGGESSQFCCVLTRRCHDGMCTVTLSASPIKELHTA